MTTNNCAPQMGVCQNRLATTGTNKMSTIKPNKSVVRVGRAKILRSVGMPNLRRQNPAAQTGRLSGCAPFDGRRMGQGTGIMQDQCRKVFDKTVSLISVKPNRLGGPCRFLVNQGQCCKTYKD